MRRPFLQLDVFANAPCLGNPVAVVLDEEESLSSEMMQRCASWTNLSETVFVSRREGGYKARIFTPSRELPFAGHPTIGAAHAALHWGLIPPGHFHQECGLGDVPLQGSLKQGVHARLERPIERTLSLDPDALSDALGAQVCAPRLLDTGPCWLVAQLAHADTLHAITPHLSRLAVLEEEQPIITGTTLYALDQEGVVHVRSFVPRHGIPEDPVCGSGNVCVGEHMRLEGVKQVGDSWVARQGSALGRDGYVHISLEEAHTTLGGRAHIIFEGHATL